MAPKQGNLKLPKKLIDQLGGEDALAGGRRPRTRIGSRKETRKAARVEKKALRIAPPQQKRLSRIVDYDEDLDDPAPQHQPRAKAIREPKEDLAKPKSILKRTKKTDPVPSTDRSRSITRPLRGSRSVKNKLAEDDEEIEALERKLGLKGRKGLPQSFKDDGLDKLLEGLGDDGRVPEVEGKRERKAEGDKWLERKRKQARTAPKGEPVKEEGENEDYSDSDEDKDDDSASNMSLDGPEFPDNSLEDDLSQLGGATEALGVGDEFEGFDSEDDTEDSKLATPRVRENPYVAPTSSDAPATKYIPPSLRKLVSSNSEALVRLRRQLQGLVNRLTEANLISILGEIEKLYRNYPRQHVTSTLVDLLLISVCEPSSLPDTLIILPAGLIAAVYKIIGTDFGAQIIQRITELFDEHYARASANSQGGPAAATTDSSKETSNLIILLSEMYNFQVVGSSLIFNYVRLFLEKLSELNAELLLKIVRTSGPQLRQDDPSSLKDIVAMLRPAVARVGGEENISVRTKFMIETINDLKNNKMKTGGQVFAVTSEHTIRMKKILGSLNSRNIKGSEPLRIGLKDVRDSDSKGKWWLVGASWSGNSADGNNDHPKEESTSKRGRVSEDTGISDLFQLAREHRMNTGIRRAIFVAVMSAEDYEDAYLRVIKLQLKKVQEHEIPKVLIHCSGAEKAYNPYYTLIAKKVCADKKLKTAFQYCLWDLFKKMGESDDTEDPVEGDEESLDTRHVVNLAKMFGTLIVEGSLGLIIFKNLNMSYLQSKTKTFLEVLFITVLLQSQKDSESKRDEQAVATVFKKARDTPQLISGLQYFIKKVVSKTDIAGGKDEKATVKWACKIVGDTLETLVALDVVKD